MLDVLIKYPKPTTHSLLRKSTKNHSHFLRYLYRTFLITCMLCRQMYTVLCYLTQFYY
jgi:hypothetical protein